MDKWFRYLNEARQEEAARKSAAGIASAIKTLTGQGGNEGGNPTGMKKVEDPLEDKDDEKKISAPPGAPGGGSAGNPGPALEEDTEIEESRQDTRPKKEPTPFKSKAQKRYKRARCRGDIYSTIAGHKNPKIGAPFSTTPKKSGTDRLRFEEVEPESFEKNDTLEPHFWQNDKLSPKISKRLLKIANDFIEGMDIDVTVEDVRFTGSLANYNWSRYSDVDLHLVVDFSKVDEDVELVKAFFDAARMRWNGIHHITIYGYEVEIYVENVGDDHRSSGVYSITEDDWIAKPDSSDVHVDFAVARLKSDDILQQINLIQRFADSKPEAALSAIERLKAKIRNMRRAGLQSSKQEFSSENIAFKILRREDALQKLNDMKYNSYDSIMSLRLQ